MQIPIIYVTHDPIEALILGNSVLILNKGRIAAEGKRDQLEGLLSREYNLEPAEIRQSLKIKLN